MNWLVSLSKKVRATEILELVDCLFGDLPYIRNKRLDSNAVRSLSFSKAPEDIFREKAGLRVHTSDVPPAVLSDPLCAWYCPGYSGLHVFINKMSVLYQMTLRILSRYSTIFLG